MRDGPLTIPGDPWKSKMDSGLTVNPDPGLFLPRNLKPFRDTLPPYPPLSTLLRARVRVHSRLQVHRKHTGNS